MLHWFSENRGSATVVPFDWSGRNSIAERQAAAASLAECLELIHENHPTAAIYVIAHSHGGSVFAYAMKLHPELVDKIHGFVALATPWIGLEPRTYAAELRAMRVRLALHAAFVAGLVAAVPVVTWAVSAPIFQSASINRTSLSLCDATSEAIAGIRSVVDAIVAYVMELLLALVLGLTLLFPLNRLVSRRLQRSSAAFHAELDVMARSLSTVSGQLPPSVFFKAIGDEAALAMTWTSAMAVLMHAASSFLFVSLQWARRRWLLIPRSLRLIGGLLLTAAWSVGTAMILSGTLDRGSLTAAIKALPDDMPPIPWVPMTAVVVWTLCAWAIATLVVMAVVAVSTTAYLAALGAGIPSLKAALYLRLSVEATPVGSHRVVLVDVSLPPVPQSREEAVGGLRHSAVYSTPSAIQADLESLAIFETAPEGTSRKAP